MSVKISSIFDIVAHKQQEIQQRKAACPIANLQKRVRPASAFRFEEALHISAPQQSEKTTIRFILEVKPASPSAGILAEHFELMPVLAQYNRFASALSVLTDQQFFHGSLDLLAEVVQQSPHPALCKDFILDPYQIYEARLAGADAILLIVKILEDTQLAMLHKLAMELGMTPVVEVQNQDELERALAVSPKVILMNNRNLETFEISLDTTAFLAPLIPEGIIRISASGIESRQDIEKLLPYSHCFLIGSALMRIPVSSLGEKLQELAGT